MTDTEAKALALELRGHACKFYSNMAQSKLWSALIAAADYIETTAATEARHAAEMRELKERFSEAAAKAKAIIVDYVGTSEKAGERKAAFLTPFILPAPEPLVEVLTDMECPDAASIGRELRAAMQARGYEWRKIGEAGE